MVRVRFSFTTGTVRSTILATAGLLVSSHDYSVRDANGLVTSMFKLGSKCSKVKGDSVTNVHLCRGSEAEGLGG